MILTAKLTALVTIAIVIYTFILGARVGALRGKKGIAAPATTGDPEFERAFRVHYNTLENLILLIPVLWLAVGIVADLWTAILGVLWLLGRIVYSSAYMKDPAGRGTGTMMSMAAIAALVVIDLYGIVMVFLA